MSKEYMIDEFTQKISQQVLQESHCIEKSESTDYIIDLMKMADTASNSKAVDNCIGELARRFKVFTGQKARQKTYPRHEKTIEGIRETSKDKNLNLRLNLKLKSAFIKKQAEQLNKYKDYLRSDDLPDDLKDDHYLNDGNPFEISITDLKNIADELATESEWVCIKKNIYVNTFN